MSRGLGCFGCCLTKPDIDDDVAQHGVGVGRIKYADKSSKKPLLALTNGESDDARDRKESVYETPTYVVEASVVTVSGLQPVQVFEGTIFQESERRGLKKFSANSEASSKKKRRQGNNQADNSSKSNELTAFQHAALQLLRCGQMLYGSGQENSAGIMFERSLQVQTTI